MKANVSSKKKKREKGKNKNKKKKKRKRKRRKIATLYLETRARSKGYMAKAFKPGALSQLVGSHRLSAHYMGG